MLFSNPGTPGSSSGHSWDSSKRMRNSKADSDLWHFMYTELLATDIMLKSSDIASDFVGDSDHRLKFFWCTSSRIVRL